MNEGRPSIPHRRKPAGEPKAVQKKPEPKPTQTVDAMQVMKLFLTEQQETIKAFLTQQQIERKREHDEEFLNLAESAAVLRLPRAHVYRAVRDGRLPAIKAGGWRIQRLQLAAFRG